jgi:hypothetical protein
MFPWLLFADNKITIPKLGEGLQMFLLNLENFGEQFNINQISTVINK